MARGEVSVRAVVIAGAGFLGLVVLVELAGYLFGWRWTGYFNREGHPNQLWDWLTLLLQPLTLALLPLWLRSRHHAGRSWVFVAVAVAVLFVVVVLGGYLLDWTWTGFAGNTVWDWLGLFLMPFLLPLVLLVVLQRQSHPPPGPAPHHGSSHGSSGGASGEPDATRQQSVSTPVAAASVAIVVAALVAGGFGVARVGASSTDSASGSASADVTAVQRVTVLGRDPFWTDTTTVVHRGERVRVTAFGDVVAHPSWPAAGPGGRAHAGARSLLASVPHAALVAMVASPGRTRPLAAGDPSPRAVLVGTARTFTAPADGDLFLGVNDLVTGDNRGWFGATVELLSR